MDKAQKKDENEQLSNERLSTLGMCIFQRDENEQLSNERLSTLGMCIFQRAKDAHWEPGISLNGGNLALIDQYGKMVDEVWDWHDTSWQLSLNVEALFGAVMVLCNLRNERSK